MTHTRDMFGGVLPVFQTPYHDDESVDWETLEKEIAWLFDQGAEGVVMAMVSETLRLTTDERQEMAQRVCRWGGARGAVVISVGAEAAVIARQLARHAQDQGAWAVMAIPPIAVALGEDSLLGYYRHIIEAVNIPVIVQDASGYLGRPMSIAMQSRLLEEYGADRVQYKPEAQPMGQRLSALREATGGKARIFEGTGGIGLVDNYRRGVVGTMPGADTIRAIVSLWRALEAGDAEQADRIAGPLAMLVSMQTSLDAFLAVEKHLLVRQGVFKNTIVRGPVGYTLDASTCAEVDRLFDVLMRAVEVLEDKTCN